MGTAVERLEIWTAAMLLLVAMIVGAAGTLAWVNDTPERTGRTVDRILCLGGLAAAHTVGVSGTKRREPGV